jgi:hypothetical protein
MEMGTSARESASIIRFTVFTIPNAMGLSSLEIFGEYTTCSICYLTLLVKLPIRGLSQKAHHATIPA